MARVIAFRGSYPDRQPTARASACAQVAAESPTLPERRSLPSRSGSGRVRSSVAITSFLLVAGAITLVAMLVRGKPPMQPELTPHPEGRRDPAGTANPDTLSARIEREAVAPASGVESGAGGVAAATGSPGTHVVVRVGDDPETQTIEEGLLVEGKREGRWRTLRPEGEIWSEKEYKNGVLDGRMTVWSASGWKESDIDYVAGRIDGLVIAWHPNGQKALEERYSLGKPSGPWKEWNADGQLKGEGHSLAGAYDGRCVFYSKDGLPDVARSGIYKAGKKLSDLP